MSSKHADFLDQASENELASTELFIAQVRERNKPEQVKNEDGTWQETECIDCGDEIPLARLELGKVRCVYCQEALEKRQRFGGM
ncbi:MULTISPECIES: TraR/DksA C4-type zinc finger protein [Oligella]|uniref:Phage/conjugal plasmid C-4 type zinc finger protein, TraR family n=1 Tax=Oligella urethralis TaxID=90245 RepID=A0A2X1UWH1_9BURK|nr:TraR/DksA C4-type zinc finger protein [Oligella urethralis]OFV49737.1 hypothetical protein HMPREF3179_03765 [Oligella sp. HMSC09E12]SPY08073.1 phage/conjugal plasmid C-4 type zinc finger protein, TraR family [Oligella urethralis]